MPALQIRDLPDDLYERLKRLSEQEHRSLSGQATVLLEEALSNENQDRDRRSEIIEAIDKHREEWSGSLPEPADLVAEDRER